MMDKYFNKLEELVFKEKYTIRAINVTNLFSIHIKKAQFILESFAEKHNNLIIKYGLVGYRGEQDDDVGARRYIEIEKEDIENEKKNFTKLISCTIKSIKDKNNLLNRMYDLDTQDLQLNKDEVIKYQKNGFYLNTNFDFREKQVRDLFNRIEIKNTLNNSTKKEENNITNTDKSDSKNESKIKTIKIENKKPDLFASFKQASKPKDNEIKQNGKEEDKNDEFIKLKNQSNELDNKNGINDIEMEDSNDEPINKNVKDIKKKNDKKLNDFDSDDEPISKSTKQIKRTSKQLDSDSDDFSKENIKHKNKKQRKRIAKVFDDSSDDELEQQNNEMEEEQSKSSYRPPKEEISSKLVEEEETYTDEEGYKVVRKTKKIVKEEPKTSQIDKTTKSVNDTTNKQQKNDNRLENKKKSDSIDDKKSIPKSKQPAKNQTSIMSFFKPKNQSK